MIADLDADFAKWIVRDTLEQIDVTKRLIAEHPNDLQYCDNPKCIRDAFKAGKVASMIGIEVSSGWNFILSSP